MLSLFYCAIAFIFDLIKLTRNEHSYIYTTT